MNEPPKVGERVRWSELTPNPHYRGRTGTVVAVSQESYPNAYNHPRPRITIRPDPGQPNFAGDRVNRNIEYLESLGPSPAEIEAAIAGIDRILSS